MKDNASPSPPEEVVALCKYLMLFNDDETAYELRPILYVWWA